MRWMAGFQFPVRARDFSYPQRPARFGTWPVPYPMLSGSSFAGGKATGLEAELLRLSNAEVKN
jgi:hypothetical protein